MKISKRLREPEGLIVRGAHFFLTLGVVLVIFFKNPELKQHIEKGEYLIPVLIIALVCSAMVLYFVASLMDPGYVKNHQIMKMRYSKLSLDDEVRMEQGPSPGDAEDSGLSSASEEEEEEEVLTENRSMLPAPTQPSSITNRKCIVCKQLQPLRAKHCTECHACVRRYDHHCPWLQNCVGERNHKWFWLFLLNEAAILAWGINLTWHSFVFKLTWGEWWKENVLPVIVMAILLFTIFVTVTLWCCHSYLIALNLTTWEFMSRQRITYLEDTEINQSPFNEGIFCNYFKFIFYCSARQWDILYSKKMPAAGTV